MARPVNSDAAATRQRILESALAVFAEKGANNSSLREIARGARVSVAMVSHYFGSKEELYGACIDSMYEHVSAMQAMLVPAIAEAEDLGPVLERAIRTSFQFVRAHQTAARLLNRTVMEAGGLDPKRRAREQLPFLENASRALGARMNRPARELRMILQSVTSLVSRYAISSAEELMAVTEATSEDEASRRIEDHLVLLASRAFGVRGD